MPLSPPCHAEAECGVAAGLSVWELRENIGLPNGDASIPRTKSVKKPLVMPMADRRSVKKVVPVMHISEKPKLVTIFGGSGFIGRHVVRALAKRGYRIRVAVRRPDLAYHLRPLGNVGQIQAVQANVRYRWTVERAIEGSHTVINLVGFLTESGKQSFAAVQQSGAIHVAEAAKAQKARLILGSAIGADSQADSLYASTKGAADETTLAIDRKAIILRPSVVFGPEDSFFNRLAGMARLSPVLPLIGGGHTRFQPVFVGDVAEMTARAVDGKLAAGKVYELGGPEIVTFRECIEIVLAMTGRRRLLAPVPWFLASAIAQLTGWMPGAPLTRDQLIQLRVDNIVSEEARNSGRTLQGAGITPQTMDAILPSYLVMFRPQGQFTRKSGV
jgi:uncharacterized protein YbjT (DUF2867 family)